MLKQNCPSQWKKKLLKRYGNNNVGSTDAVSRSKDLSPAPASTLENYVEEEDKEDQDLLLVESNVATAPAVSSRIPSPHNSSGSKKENLFLNPYSANLSNVDIPARGRETFDELADAYTHMARKVPRMHDCCDEKDMYDAYDDDDDEEEETKNVHIFYQEDKKDVEDEEDESDNEVAIARDGKESSSGQSTNVIPAIRNDFLSAIPCGSSSSATKVPKHPDSRICKGTLLFEHRAKISQYASHWTSCQDCIKFWKLRRLEAKVFNDIKISMHLYRDLLKKEGMLGQIPLRYPKEICYRLFDILPKKMPVVYYYDLLNNIQIIEFRTNRIRCPGCKIDVNFPIVDVASTSDHSCNPRNIDTKWEASRSTGAIKMERGRNFEGKIAVFTFTRLSKGSVSSKNQANFTEQHKFRYELAEGLLAYRLECGKSNIKHAQQYHKSGPLKSTIVRAKLPTPDTFPFVCISEQWNDDDVFGTYDHYYMSMLVTADFSCSPYYFLEWINSLQERIQEVRLMNGCICCNTKFSY